RAGGGGRLRPRLGRALSARDEAAALPAGHGAGAVPHGAAGVVSAGQFDLFGAPGPVLPEGLSYAEGVIDAEAQARRVEVFAGLPFEAFDFHGFKGNRRIVSY